MKKQAEQAEHLKTIAKMVLDEVENLIAVGKKLQPSAWQQFKALAPTAVVGGAATALTAKIPGLIKNKLETNSLMSKITENRKQILSSFPQADQAKAGARFDEVAQIAPSVAANAPLVSKMVREHLHSGISSDQAQKLALIQYNYGIKKVGSVRPEVLGDIVADIYIIKEAAAPKSYIGRAGDFAKHLAVLSSIPLMVNTVGGAINMVSSKLKEKSLKKELDAAYLDAVKGNNEISAVLRAKPDAARNAFNTLVHFAPSIALNPQAARGFMAKLVEYEGRLDMTDLKSLTEVQKNMHGIKPQSAFAAGFSGTSDTLGMKPLIHSSAAAAQNEVYRDLEQDPEWYDVAHFAMKGKNK